MISTHCFSIEEATKFGVNKAILLYNIRFWLTKNKANKKSCKDGFYWTYNSGAAFGELFPYFSVRSIERWLKELADDGVLLSRNLNKYKYDKTKWYTIPDEFMTDQPDTGGPEMDIDESESEQKPTTKLAESIRQNGGSNRQDGGPIPNINTNNNDINDFFIYNEGSEKKVQFSSSPIPDDFGMTDDMKSFALTQGHSEKEIGILFKNYLAYYRANKTIRMTDWSQHWEAWLLNRQLKNTRSNNNGYGKKLRNNTLSERLTRADLKRSGQSLYNDDGTIRAILPW